MTIEQQFRRAWRGDDDPDTAMLELFPVRLARATAQVLDVPGAGMSVLTGGKFRVPLGASDDAANTAERLQFTHGAGPCLHAVETGALTRVTARRFETEWPALYSELRTRTAFCSVVSVPLRFGPGRSANGALDLYLAGPDAGPDLDDAGLETIGTEIVNALQFSEHEDQHRERPVDQPMPAWLHGPSARQRTQVWVALGVLNASLDLPAPDALARLRAYAYARDLLLDDVAEALVTRELPADQLQL